MYEARQNKKQTFRTISFMGQKRHSLLHNNVLVEKSKKMANNNLNICIQPKYPDRKLAKQEFNNDIWRAKYFNTQTQNLHSTMKYMEGRKLLKETGEIKLESTNKKIGQLEYAYNPRSKQIMNRESLLNILQSSTLTNVIKNSHNVWVMDVKQCDYGDIKSSIPEGKDSPENIHEYTYAYANRQLVIAPNPQSSSDTRFVHPMLWGGWKDVEAAGTMQCIRKGNSFIIEVTNDSGHYKIDNSCIDIVIEYLKSILNVIKVDNNPNKQNWYHYKEIETK